MRNLLVILFCCSIGRGALAECSFDTTTIKNEMEIFINTLSKKKIYKIKVNSFSYDLRTSRPISREEIDNAPERSVYITASNSIQESLKNALLSTKIDKSQYIPDLRWGAEFYNESGEKIYSIYLGQRYFFGLSNKGYLNSQCVGLNDAIRIWFEDNFFQK